LGLSYEITLSPLVQGSGGMEGNSGNSQSESSWQHRHGADIYRAAGQLNLSYKLGSKSACLGFFASDSRCWLRVACIAGKKELSLVQLIFWWWLHGAGQCR